MSAAIQRYRAIIQKPVITEKATGDQERRNAYHFRVPPDANKVEIRRAVEVLFGVKVASVNTTKVRGKWRRRGYGSGQAPDWKRAMVTLREGHTIEFH